MRKETWYMLMTTEGGLGYRDILSMTDQERVWWLQRCIEHNDAIEEMRKNPR